MRPSAPELEKLVLGAILLEGIDDRVNFLRPEHFINGGNNYIFKAIQYLKSKNEAIDLATVARELAKRNQLETAGGSVYMAELTNRIASSANIETHARILVQEFLSRELLDLTQKINISVDSKNDVFDTITETQVKLDGLIENNVQHAVEDFASIQDSTIKHLEMVCERVKNGETTGIPTGFKRLDKITGGWQNSDLVILAARPAMGKTALMLSLAMNAAKSGFPVALFSLEMSKLQLTYRMQSSYYCIDLNRFFHGNVYQDEIQMMKGDPLNLPLFIDDTGSLHINSFKNRARIAVRKHGVKMIVVDYLQLMRGDKNNREQEITEISGGLKEIAKELNVPVIALCQLSRAVESEPSKIPKLSHLRESGSIEQDADIVSFLWRPEYYGITENEAGESTEGLAKLFIAKNRNGSLATGDYGITLNFEGKYTKFKDCEQPVSNEPQPF